MKLNFWMFPAVAATVALVWFLPYPLDGLITLVAFGCAWRGRR